ncbi:MAG: hypothetical protein JWN49_314 [Parcubacteria group bacterium]|nr:hypothetical protein [Parcubacteria group bacterium]
MPLDIGVGILLSLGVAELFHVPATIGFILLGIGCALLPDVDIITMLFGSWKHRTHTHYPITYIPVSIIIFALFGPIYGLLFTLAVYAHLIHDTIGIGWGIAWLWPFSSRKFLFFPDDARRKTLGTFATWTPEEEPAIKAEGSNSNWVRDFYFRPNFLAYIEYGTLLIALAALFLYKQ